MHRVVPLALKERFDKEGNPTLLRLELEPGHGLGKLNSKRLKAQLDAASKKIRAAQEVRYEKISPLDGQAKQYDVTKTPGANVAELLATRKPAPGENRVRTKQTIPVLNMVTLNTYLQNNAGPEELKQRTTRTRPAQKALQAKPTEPTVSPGLTLDGLLRNGEARIELHAGAETPNPKDLTFDKIRRVTTEAHGLIDPDNPAAGIVGVTRFGHTPKGYLSVPLAVWEHFKPGGKLADPVIVVTKPDELIDEAAEAVRKQLDKLNKAHVGTTSLESIRPDRPLDPAVHLLHGPMIKLMIGHVQGKSKFETGSKLSPDQLLNVYLRDRATIDDHPMKRIADGRQ
ncbi:TPA: hypothetical protein HA318_04730 [Candidatus Micrarchaeota archaeon]|nr:hypothetical protein [Candidatus Micrarchaeota archaeon]